MYFPNPPFKLNNKKKGDISLLKYLKRGRSSFTFLSTKTRNQISKLKLDKDKDLRKEQKSLLKIWPLVLKDALYELKRRDPREWPNPNDKKMGSFFDESSLGINELEEVLNGFSKFEGMMYGASPDTYRDHVVHSFRVWIIGHGILKRCLGECLALDVDLEKEISPIEWECMWAIVALCHDIGYPLSHIDKINQTIREALLSQGLLSEGDLRYNFSQQMLSFHDTVIRLMASKPVKLLEILQSLKNDNQSTTNQGENNVITNNNSNGEKNRIYVTHLQNKYYLKLLKSFDELDHGIVSSLLISKALVYFLESDFCHDSLSPLTKEDARQFMIRREILRAIANHTCQDIYHLKFNTLSFLLYMVDEIQCWGRPTLEMLQHEPADIREGEAEVKEFSQSRIDIRITTEDKEWKQDQTQAIKKWIGKLRRMLRLAVGTRKYEIFKSYLHFEARNEKGQRCFLQLRNGRLTGPKIKMDHSKKTSKSKRKKK